MSEPVLDLIRLHPGRAGFPADVRRALKEAGQDETLLAFAWELAQLPPDLDPRTRRDLLLLVLALQVTQGQGHTRMAVAPGPDGSAGPFLAACRREPLDIPALLADPRLACLVGSGDEPRPLIREGDWLTTHRLRACELDLSARVLALGTTFPGAPTAMAVATLEAILAAPVALNPQQRQAVGLALSRPLALLTGGPGTGKTSIIAAILRALLAQGLEPGRIALAAPTGKAAQRMGEAIRGTLARLAAPSVAEEALGQALPEPQTLHRLLSWHPGQERFRHHAGNPLAAAVVIVDEASMVSLELMDRLLQALAPGARLVLLGDADQLPSVEAGSVFRDLVATLPEACQALTENHRMAHSGAAGRHILEVATRLRDGREEALWAGSERIQVRTALADLGGAGVELLEPGPGQMRAFLEGWFRERVLGLAGFEGKANHLFHFGEGGWGPGEDLLLNALFGHFEGFRILCALRRAPDFRGVEDINDLLHGWMHPLTGGGLRRETPFLAGEPVLMTANDYRREIFNGDQGIVLKVAFEGDLRQAAVFQRADGFRAFPLEALKGQLELCYAMTVHKSQGSEYARVVLPLPQADHPALTRELMYTALTRAKESVILLGAPGRVAFAARNRTRRDTGIAQRLTARRTP